MTRATMADWLVLLASVITGVVGQLALKRAMSGGDLLAGLMDRWSGLWRIALQPYIVLYGCAAVVSALTWFWVVRRFDLGFAYPVVQSLAFVLILLSSSWMFAEQVGVARWVGVALICAGLVLCR